MNKVERTDTTIDLLASNKISSERLIFKDNALIMASYSLSVEEQRLILACIGKAQEMKAPLKSEAIEISLNVNEYAALYQVQVKHAYKALKQSSDKLFERSISLKSEGKQTRVRWLQEQATYESGKVKLTFSNMISKHIKAFATKPSAYRLEQATQLRTQYAIRFFELFNMCIDPKTQKGEWDISLVELRKMLELEDCYPRWVDLKKYIILDSINQINKNTSLRADWEVSGKVGKQITHVRFSIFESEQLELSL